MQFNVTKPVTDSRGQVTPCVSHAETPDQCRRQGRDGVCVAEAEHCIGKRIDPVPDQIDLRPLIADPAATEMLLLARGQLNRAFRTHGLTAPDPVAAASSLEYDPGELDDPAAMGIEHARDRFGEAFVRWADAMPRKLARPVLDILHQTYQALDQQRDHSSGASRAVLKAYEFLLACSEPHQDRLGGA
jgi:hypothetical protein